MKKCRFRKLGLDAGARGLKLWRKALKLKYLSEKTTNNKGFECSQLEGWLFLHYFAEKNEIEHLQLFLLSLDNNLSKKNSKKALEFTKPDKNSGCLYL